MAEPFSQGATGKPLTATITNADDTPVDLTGCTVRFSMARRNTPTVAKVAAAACTIVSAAAGQVSYQWVDADVNTVGLYRGQFKVTLPSGRVIYAPTDETGEAGFIDIEIVPVVPTA